MELKLYKGDCLELLKDIKSNSVDLILIDPPYNLGKAVEKEETYYDLSVKNIKDAINGNESVYELELINVGSKNKLK